MTVGKALYAVVLFFMTVSYNPRSRALQVLYANCGSLAAGRFRLFALLCLFSGAVGREGSAMSITIWNDRPATV